MAALTIETSGLAALAAKLQALHEALCPALESAVTEAVEYGHERLHDAAPIGRTIEALHPQPVGDDAPGPLISSFYTTVQKSDTLVRGTVSTTQPQKLKFVVEGRGPVVPTTKKALYWEGAEHPVKRVGPVAPNDFVSPIVAEVQAFFREALTAALMDVFQILYE